MTSCRGGGDNDGGERSPPAAVYHYLVEVREHAMMLQRVLQGSSSSTASDAQELVKAMMAKLSSAMSVLGNAGGAASSSGQRPGGRRMVPGAAASPWPHSPSSSRRRRTKSPFIEMVTAKTTKDGKSWRKYGQKQIHASTSPRSYYRCTHKPDQGCMATRQVQESESNPSEFVISYYGTHTCRDPSTFSSLVDVQDAGAAAPSNCTNLISFAPINGGGAATASTSTGAFPHRSVEETMDHPMLFNIYSNSFSPAQESAPFPACYDFEEFVQYAGGELGDGPGRMTSVFTVGSAPALAEYWPVVGVAGVDMDAGAGMVGRFFPSPPISPGFLSGSVGSFDNNLGGGDDQFGFDS